MKWPGHMIVAGVLALPASTPAQVVGRQDLVGIWVTTVGVWPPTENQSTSRVLENILTLQMDSTWTSRMRLDGKEDIKPLPLAIYHNTQPAGRWYLADDTIWFTDPAKLLLDRHVDWGYKISRKDQHLVLTGLQKGDCPQTFLRTTSSTAPPPMLPPSTVNPAGTWFATRSDWTANTKVDANDTPGDTLIMSMVE